MKQFTQLLGQIVIDQLYDPGDFWLERNLKIFETIIVSLLFLSKSAPGYEFSMNHRITKWVRLEGMTVG